MEGLVNRHSDERPHAGGGLLHTRYVDVYESPVVLNQVGARDDGGNGKHARAQRIPEPHQCGHERERVRGHVGGERAPRNRVGTQAAALVLRLPLGLEGEIAHQVRDREDREDLYPRHPADPTGPTERVQIPLS